MGLFNKKSKWDTPDGIHYYIKPLIDKVPQAKYYMVFGERSSGKTTSCLMYALEQYVKNGGQFAYIRRMEEDTKGKRAASLFDGISALGFVSDITNGEYNSVYYYSGRFYFSKFDKDTMTRVNSPEPIGYTFCLSTMEHDKSSSFPNIRTVVFDEFLTRTTYLVDEFVIFCNVLSTIIRDRNDVKIFMLGNTVNKYCPYFKEMGISKQVKQMKLGDVVVATYGDSGLYVAIEYTGGSGIRASKPSDVYFAFGNPKLQMITSGAWELDIYPHCPMKIRPKDIKQRYFIEFDDELLEADIVKRDHCVFTFIHRKTTPIKNEDKDWIYSQKYDPRRNWHRCIDKPFDPLSKLIWSQFIEEKVYYQDNEVGDVVMNYKNWCMLQR